MLCFIWGGLYLKIQNERRLERDSAMRETANYARTFEEHTLRTIRGLDEMALFLKYKAEKEGLSIDLPLLMAEGRFIGQPFVQLGIADSTGLVVSSLVPPTARTGISDLEHFMAHQQADTGKLYIGQPVIGRISGKWSMQLSRRVNRPDGSFGGVVVVAVDPYYFAEFYKQINLGPKANISLIGKDGILRVRQSEGEVSFGLNFSRRISDEMSKGDSGSYIDSSIVDGIKRVFSYRKLKDYPLIVAVGMSEDYVFSDLNKRISAYYWACGTMTMVIVLFVSLLLRGFVRRKKTEDELAANKDRYQALIDQSFDAVAIFSLDTQEVFEVNQQFTELFGYSLPADSPFFVADFIADTPESINRYLDILRAQKHVAPGYRTFRHKSGRLIEVERTATLIRFEERELVMSTMRELTQERRREREIARDARHARRVQEGLLPLVQGTANVDVWTMNQPSHVVSGDLYHLAWNEDKTVLRGYLVDVSGHGLATAIQTAAINVLLHEVAALPLPLVSQMAWINRRVSQYFAEDAFAAGICFELDLYAGEVRYVAAGVTEFYHNARRIITPGLMLGIKPEGDFGTGTIQLASNDIFAFLTDGLTDVFTREDWASHSGDFGELTAWIKKTAENEDVRDDATAICFCIKRLSKKASGKAGWPQGIRLRGYADYWRLRPKVTQWLMLLTGQKHSKIEVAVQEAIVNALECKDAECRSHEATVKINLIGRRLIVRVATNRLGFPGNALLRRMRGKLDDVFENTISENMGRGLPIMFALAERMTYNADGTEVLMAWRLSE